MIRRANSQAFLSLLHVLWRLVFYHTVMLAIPLSRRRNGFWVPCPPTGPCVWSQLLTLIPSSLPSSRYSLYGTGWTPSKACATMFMLSSLWTCQPKLSQVPGLRSFCVPHSFSCTRDKRLFLTFVWHLLCLSCCILAGRAMSRAGCVVLCDSPHPMRLCWSSCESWPAYRALVRFVHVFPTLTHL